MQANVRKDLTGKRFGLLVVLKHIRSSPPYRILCKCDCGSITRPLRTNVSCGRTSSCGCGVIDAARKRTKHGHAAGGRAHFTREYKSWEYMLRRVRYKGSRSGRWHADRGITSCKRWLRYDLFFRDMGKQPKGTTLERIDNDKGYSPSNCRWATMREQSRNKRNNRFFKFHGRRLVVPDWSNITGFSKSAIWYRINAGWPISKVLTQPVRKSRLRR